MRKSERAAVERLAQTQDARDAVACCGEDS